MLQDDFSKNITKKSYKINFYSFYNKFYFINLYIKFLNLLFIYDKLDIILF